MEITALNRELDDVDRQMVAAQQRLDAAGDIERALRKQVWMTASNSVCPTNTRQPPPPTGE